MCGQSGNYYVRYGNFYVLEKVQNGSKKCLQGLLESVESSHAVQEISCYLDKCIWKFFEPSNKWKVRMFSAFCDKCEDYMAEKSGGEMPLNFAKLYGLIVSTGLYIENNPYGKKVSACGEEARSIWGDFANDFSCLPDTGIWLAVAKSAYYDKLDAVETVQDMYNVLFDFFAENIELFDDRA